jgi:hypothetical protein
MKIGMENGPEHGRKLIDQLVAGGLIEARGAIFLFFERLPA